MGLMNEDERAVVRGTARATFWMVVIALAVLLFVHDWVLRGHRDRIEVLEQQVQELKEEAGRQ